MSFALLLAAATAARPARAALPPATADAWVEVRSARLHVYSNAGEAVARRAARHLERLADAMERTTSGLKVDGEREVRVYVFKDLASFRPYRGLVDDDYGGLAGYHVTGRDAEYITYYDESRGAPLEFAAHEYTHAVLARSLGVLPVWVNEGLAEYFSTFEPKSRGAQIGRAIPQHIDWLRSHVLSLEYILRLGGNNPDYEQGERRATIYAESWALVHSLILSPQRSEHRFDALLNELVRGTESVRALRKVYGPNALDSLTGAIRQMAERPSLPYIEWSFAEDFDVVRVQTRILDGVETCTVLGELLAHAPDALHPLAQEHLRAAWGADSSRTLAAALLGQLAERAGDHDAADRWFGAVERSAPGQARACAMAGEVLAERGRSGTEALGWPAPGSPAVTLRARALLARALESAPDRSEWLASYGLTFLDDSTGHDEGMGALILAHPAWPRRSDIAGGLSMLNLRAGNRGAAIAMYGRIPPGPEHDLWRWRAGWLIAHEMHAAITALGRDGRIAEAETLLVHLRRDVTEQGVADRCERLRTWLKSVDAARAENRAASENPGAGGRRPAPQDGSARRDGSTAASGAPASGAATDAPLARAMSALDRGDFAEAESQFTRLAERAGSAPRRARLDSLTARARNLRRHQVASELITAGSFESACRLLDMIVGDRPDADIRRNAERLRSRACNKPSR